MPTYEYACKACGEHLEVVQSFNDNALTQCPACGGDLRKVFGNIGIAFKGSGFYRTDSRSSPSSSGAKGEAKAAEAKAAEAKTENKGEAKSDSTKSSGESSSGSSAPSTGSGPSTSSKPAVAAAS